MHFGLIHIVFLKDFFSFLIDFHVFRKDACAFHIGSYCFCVAMQFPTSTHSFWTINSMIWRDFLGNLNGFIIMLFCMFSGNFGWPF